MQAEIRIEAYSIDDKAEVIGLLKDADLPFEDLNYEKMQHFLVAKVRKGVVVGAVGIEVCGDYGLLRSLITHPDWRSKGLGTRLTREIESHARSKGIKVLYLLTMTAADFFPKLGYQTIPRNTVPEVIQQTDEFNSVCPVSAACLCKEIATD